MALRALARLSPLTRVTAAAAKTAAATATPVTSGIIAVLPRPVAAVASSRRWLNIHETDSTDVLREHGVNTAAGGRAYSAKEAVEVFESLGTDRAVVKAQVLAGGRGKGHFANGFQGGVHMCTGAAEIAEVAGKMIGDTLITKQTGEEGRPCNMVHIAAPVDIAKEYYFAVLLDRATAGPMVVGSAEGGMNIEEVAAERPEAIIKLPVDVKVGLQAAQAEEMARKIGISEDSIAEASDQMVRMYDMFMGLDCTQIEINPLVEASDGSIMCLDAKLNFDDNAAYRQADIFARRDISQERTQDVEASKYDLNFISLDGNIGCLVNGAGLAMATMDIIQLKGGSPANFLDVGGGATVEQVTAAFRLITSDNKVNAILVNIFGGIMRCDVIAEGIITACQDLNLTVPIIVRLQGTKKAEAKAIIAASGLDIISADDLDVAARKAVVASEIVAQADEAGFAVSFQNKFQSESPDGEAPFTPPL